MPELRESKAVERSCRLFEQLLVIYPRTHREEYGPAILQLFRDQCRDAWVNGKSRGLIGFWLHAFADLLKTSFLEHLSNLNRRKSMLKYFRPQFTPFSVFFSIFGCVFLFLFLSSVVITFMYPESFKSSTRLLIRWTATPSSLDSIIRTEFAIVQSHATLSKVSQSLNLPTVWGEKYNVGKPMSESDVEAMLLSRLELKPLPHSDIFEINAYSDSPEEAASIANKVAEAYREVRGEQANPDAGTSIAPPLRDNIIILDVATPSSIPVKPNKPLNIVLGAMMSVVMGLIAGAIGAGLIYAARKNRSPSPPLTAGT